MGVALVACGIPALDGSDKECPCADGYVCDESVNRCVEMDAGEVDAGEDARTFDSGPRMDAGGDAGDEDAGTDERDAGDFDGGVEERDAGDFDAGTDESDAGMDAGSPDPDAGPGDDCPHDGLYCTDFEEVVPPYVVRGSGDFSVIGPGFMSTRAGSYSEGASIFTEFDDVSLPSVVYARFWMHIESGFDDEAVVFAFFVPGSSSGVGVSAQVESGSVTLKAGSTSSAEFVSARSTNIWTCVQLMVSPTDVELFVDDDFEGSASFGAFSEDFDDVGFGLIEGHSGDEVIIDEVVVGASPIPCDLVD